MVGVEAFHDVVKMREAVKLEQFAQALTTDVHRGVIDHKPVDLTAAARIADEYAVLSKPIQAQTSNYSANSDNNVGTEKFSRNFNRGTGKKSSFNRHSPEINCLNCGKHGHSMQPCYALKPVAAPMSAPLTEIPEPVLQNQHFQITNSDSSTVNEQYIPFYAKVNICTTEGTQRPLTLSRDTRAMQSLVSRRRFQPFGYADTSEKRLIKGVLGQAVAVPLVEISVKSDQGDGTILCGLIDELPQGVDILVGNNHMYLVPVHVGVITRSHTRKTNTGIAVRSPNTEEDVVSDQVDK